MMHAEPKLRPLCPQFSSGPCKKHPGWSLDLLSDAAVGRSHRSDASQLKLKQAIELTRELLQVPASYKIALVPASDTGAMEMAMWNLLGPKPVSILVYEYFAKEWLYDLTAELKLPNVTPVFMDSKNIADFTAVDFNNDFVFVLNGTTVGLSIENIDFIPLEREGLVIGDASAAAFSQRLDFSRLDVISFSCQKILGAEASHGVLILSPKAMQRLESYTAAWPIPKILRLKSGGQLNSSLFQGQVINTPSMLCVEDYLASLHWVKSLGGVVALQKRIEANAAIISNYVKNSSWLAYIVENEALRAKTAQCLRIVDSDILRLSESAQKRFLDRFLSRLEELNIAYDIRNHREAPMGLRIWTGATVSPADLLALCEWLDFIFFLEKRNLNYNF